jgi:hypothetical protein
MMAFSASFLWYLCSDAEDMDIVDGCQAGTIALQMHINITYLDHNNLYAPGYSKSTGNGAGTSEFVIVMHRPLEEFELRCIHRPESGV